MKGLPLVLWMVVAALVPGFAVADEDRVTALQQAFLKQTSALQDGLELDLGKLSTSYATALEQLLQTQQKAGKLEAAVATRDEIRAVKGAVNPLPELSAASSPELKKMRGKFQDARGKFQKDHASALTSSAEKMASTLKELELQSTRAGALDQALAAKNLRESLATDPAVRDAEDLLKFAGTGARKPALVARRSGDDLEVVVYYDSQGKVSMRSPVENLREETGGIKERGDTKAKVLGEFVGADGFEVDPFVSYHQVFDKKKPDNFVLTALDAKPRHQEAGAQGIRLSFTPGADNPHVNLGEVLPAASGPGTYRITCRYLVPKTNRTVPGLFFVHGGGSPVGGKSFTGTGKWIEEETSAKPSIENRTLLLYLMIAEGKRLEDGWDDHVVIGEIKVEHRRFAAFVEKRFDEKRQPTDVQTDPSAQPRLISDGNFDGEESKAEDR